LAPAEECDPAFDGVEADPAEPPPGPAPQGARTGTPAAQTLDGRSEITMELSTFLADARPCETQSLMLCHVGWPEKQPCLTAEAQNAFARAAAGTAIGWYCREVRRRAPPDELVTVWVKPRRGVRAKRTLAPGQLVLAPDSRQVRARDGEGDREGEALLGQVRVRPASGEVLAAAPALARDSVAAYWAVQTTVDPEAANMALVAVTIALEPRATCELPAALAAAPTTARLLQARARGEAYGPEPPQPGAAAGAGETAAVAAAGRRFSRQRSGRPQPRRPRPLRNAVPLASGAGRARARRPRRQKGGWTPPGPPGGLPPPRWPR
jgi:hypothetical protein